MPRHCRSWARAGIAAGLLWVAMPAAPEALPTLFGVSAGVGGIDPIAITPRVDHTVARARTVRVEFSYLDPRTGKSAKALGVELFDGRSVILDRASIEERGAANYTWRGTVRGYGHSEAILTVVDGRIAGSIVLAEEGTRTAESYRILSIDGGTQALVRRDPARFPPDHSPGIGGMLTSAPSARTPAPAARDKQVSIDAVADENDVVAVDLMVLYSNQAAIAAGTTIDAEMQHAVDRTNAAYANSGIAIHLRLVHGGPSGYDESGNFAADLDRLGHDRGVRRQRDLYGADLVSLFVENVEFCGLGTIDADAEGAYSVVSRICAGDNLSLAHEIGHNFGARHEPEADASDAPYAYGHGYVFAAGGWRTVMAYGTAAPGTVRIAYFANPNLTYGSPPVPMGTESISDVARVHNERARSIAEFRQPSSTVQPSACTASAAPSQLPGTGGVVVIVGHCEDGGTPTYWKWTRNSTVLPATDGAFYDTLPAIAGIEAATYFYTGAACNTGGCATTPRVMVIVVAPPLVARSEAVVIVPSQAMLFAEVTSNGAKTSVTFDYGPTAAYGSSIPGAPSPLEPGVVEYPVSARISGLACDTTYHFRAVATNFTGTATGNDTPFTTGTCGAANPDIVRAVEFYNAGLDHYFITWVQ